ncbi:MAG: cyclic nucleotide-binding domain-containing protein, partial [Arenicella sp.]|nr:cyclic nucleotide-binding domain-containing protein [Arenicella sp.]
GEEQTNLVAQPYEELAQTGVKKGDAGTISQEDWVLIGLRMLSMNENKAYHKMFDQGEISPDIARGLFRRGADVSDSLKQGGVDAYVANYRDKLSFHWQTKLAMQIQRHLGRPGPLAKRLATRFQLLEAECTVLHDLREKAIGQISEMVGDSATDKILQILKQRDTETEQALASLRACYPDYANALEKRVLQQTAMRLESGHYKDMLANSLIGKEVSTKLMEEMGERYGELGQKLTLDLGLDATTLVAKMPFFEGLEASAKADIAKLLKPRLALPGETIFNKGDAPDAMYFISSGAVRVMLENNAVILGSGDFFGEMALLNSEPRMATIISDGFSELLTLYTQDFKRLLDQDDQLRSVIERVAQERARENINEE